MALRAACLEYCKRIRFNDEEVVEVELSCKPDNVRDSLGQKDLDELSAALHGNRHVKSLVLWGNKDLSSVSSLLEALKQNKTLERVNLALTGVDQAAQDGLTRALAGRRIDAIANDPDLQIAAVCDLSQMGINNADVKRLAGALRNNVCLTSLSLWGNRGISNAKNIEDLITNNPGMPLISISLDDTGIDEESVQGINKLLNAKRIKRGIAQLESGDGVKAVNLSNSSIDDKGVAKIASALRNNTTTTSISLLGNPGVTKVGLTALIDAVEASKQSQMCHIAVDPASLDAPTMTRFKAWRMAAISRLLVRDSPNLTTVDLSRMELSAKDVNKLAAAISHSSHVAHINLSRNKELSDDCLRGEGGLISIAQGHTSLVKINTSGTAISMGGLSALQMALRKTNMDRACAMIRRGGCRVDFLRGAGLEEAEIKALVASLRAGGGVYHLDLSGNPRVTDTHADMLLGATRRGNVSLVGLGLRDTSVGADKRKEARKKCADAAVAWAIGRANGAGAVLGSTLDFDGMGLDDEQVSSIAEQLWKCATVSEIILRNNPQVSDAGGEELLAALQGHSSANPRCSCYASGGHDRQDCRASSDSTVSQVTHVATGGTSMGPLVKAMLAEHCRKRALALGMEGLKAEWHPPLLRLSGEVRCLKGQRLTDQDVIKIARAIEQGEIVGLVDMSGNSGITQKSAAVLLGAVRHNQRIHTLLLGGTGVVSSPRMSEIEATLADNAMSLAMSVLASGEAGVSDLSFLRGRGLGDGNVQTLIKGLVKNPFVTRLDLGLNPDITDDAVRALEAALLGPGGRCALKTVVLDGTGASHKAKSSLYDVLEKGGERKGGEVKQRVASDGDGAVMSTLGSMQARWEEVEGDLRMVSKACSVASNTLELELKKAMLYRGSHEEAIPLPPPAQPALAPPGKSEEELTSGEKEEQDRIAGRPLPGGDLENASSAIGVRIKMPFVPASFRDDLFREDVSRLLKVGQQFIECVPRSVENVMDMNIASDPSDPTERSSHRLASILFSHCEDPSSLLCSRYNQGRPMFCHYPWSTARTKRQQSMRGAEFTGKSPLELVVLRMDASSSSSGVANSFSDLCMDMKKILDRLGVVPFVEGACAQALGKLEPLISGLSELQPFYAPESNQLIHSQRLCDDYMKHVSSHEVWTDKVQQDEEEARDRLLSHWQEVRSQRVAVQAWSDFLKRFETDNRKGGGGGGSGGGNGASGGLQLSMARRDAEGVIDALRRWLKDERRDKERQLMKHRGEQEDAKTRREKTAERIKSRREELHEAIEDVEGRKKVCLAEALAKIEELQGLEGKLLRAAAEDQRCALIEQQIKFEALKDERAVGSDEAQSGALVARLEKGMDASNELAAKVQLAIETIDSAIRAERKAYTSAERKLTCDVYNGLFCRLYALVLLVASRHEVSIEMDKEEMLRIMSKSKVLSIVGKVEKVQQAHALWSDGAHSASRSEWDAEDARLQVVSPRRRGGYGEAIQVSDRGVESQNSSLVKLLTLGQQLQIECEPVWECMAKMPHATRICEGSEVEIIVLWNRDQGSAVTFEDLPHPRALIKRVSFRVMFEEAGQKERSSMQSFLSSIVRVILRECAISSQFKVEYKQISAAARRAEDALNKAEAGETNARTRKEEAVRTCKKDEEEAGRKQADLKREEDRLRVAESDAKDASERAVTAQDELDEGREAVFEAKRKVEEIQKMLERAKEALEAAEKKVKQAVLDVKATAKVKESKGEVLERAREAHEAKLKASQYADAQVAKSENIVESLTLEVKRLSTEIIRDQKEKYERARVVLDCYNHVKDMAGDKIDMLGGGDGWLIDVPASAIVVRFTMDERFDIVCPNGDERRKEEFKNGFKKSLLYLMRNRNPDAAPDDRTARIAEMERHVSGVVSITIHMSERDRKHPIRSQIDVLRGDFFPTGIKAASPATLSTGQGRLSKVISIEVLDPIGRGFLGDVRVARLGRDIVVVKYIDTGSRAHAQGWAERVKRGLLSQFPALATVSHPNVLSYRAVCADEGPVLALVQDYCNSTLSRFLAQHSSSHHPNVTLSEKDIDDVFRALDTNCNGRVSQELFFKGLRQNKWAADKLGLEGRSLEDWLEVFHKVARDGGLSIDQEGLARYYGIRELPGTEVSWAQRIQVAVSVARGVEYLASHGLIHGNLKSANVAIVEGAAESGGASGTWLGARIAVMDFGIPHLCKTGDFPVRGMSLSSGPWHSPEVHMGGGASLQADVWALGIVLWEILTGEVPWAGKTRDQLSRLIGRDGRAPPVSGEHRVNSPIGYVDAMERCWAVEPSKRPSVTRVISSILGRWSEWPDAFLPG